MLKARVITALFLVVGLLGVLFFAPPVAATLVFAGIAALAAWEWAGLMKIAAVGRVIYAGVIVVSCLGVWKYPAVFPVVWLVAAAFWLLLAPLWLARRWRLAGNAFLGHGVGWILIVPTWAAMTSGCT